MCKVAGTSIWLRLANSDMTVLFLMLSRQGMPISRCVSFIGLLLLLYIHRSFYWFVFQERRLEKKLWDSFRGVDPGFIDPPPLARLTVV